MKLYRGYFGVPNIWLAVTDRAKAGDDYEFCVFGGVPTDDRNRLMRDCKDPYARQLGFSVERDFGGPYDLRERPGASKGISGL